MLQKSRSKIISKLKFSLLLPLMLVMLTIVSCSQESPEPKINEEPLAEHLRIINESLKNGEELTEQEYLILLELRENLKMAIYKNQKS